MADGIDPRVPFAAERTLLAWVRTGLAVIGLGFVVARFGLYLRMMSHPGQEVQPRLESTVIGVGLVLLGAAAVALAARQHVRFLHTLDAHERPRNYSLTWAVVFALLLAGAGVVLAIYLLSGIHDGMRLAALPVE